MVTTLQEHEVGDRVCGPVCVCGCYKAKHRAIHAGLQFATGVAKPQTRTV